MKNVSAKKKSMSRGAKIAIAATAAVGIAAPIVYGVMKRRSKRAGVASMATKLAGKASKALNSAARSRPAARGSAAASGKAKRA